jgi:hypothetical protein
MVARVCLYTLLLTLSTEFSVNVLCHVQLLSILNLMTGTFGCSASSIFTQNKTSLLNSDKEIFIKFSSWSSQELLFADPWNFSTHVLHVIRGLFSRSERSRLFACARFLTMANTAVQNWSECMQTIASARSVEQAYGETHFHMNLMSTSCIFVYWECIFKSDRWYC